MYVQQYTINGSHRIVLYLDSEKEECLYMKDTMPQLTLLALYPMGHVPDEAAENNSSDETENFNVEAHIQFFNENFTFFGQHFSKLYVCLIGDNFNTNLKVSSLTKKFYVGCNSHKLNL